MIPIIIKPYDDELIYSYIERLAKVNALSTKEFISVFAYPNRTRRYSIDYGSKFQYSYLTKNLGIIDDLDFYLRTSDYLATSIAVTSYTQNNILKLAFNRDIEDYTTGAGSSELVLRKCPECEKELSYYRRSHCLPGVKACYKHYCSLTNDPVTQEDIDYAQVCHELLENPLDVNYLDLYKLLGLKKIKEGKAFEQVVISILKQYGSIDNFRKQLPTKAEVFSNDGYALLSKPRNNIVKVKHGKCGTVFITNLSNANSKYSCPKCRKLISDKEYYKYEINRLGKGEYKLLSDFNTTKDLVTIRHSCGIEYQTNIYRFLQNGRCHCESGRDLNTIKDQVEACGNFKLIDYKNGSLKVHHLDCDRISSIKYKEFLLRPACPKCKTELGKDKLARYVHETKKIDPDFKLLSHSYKNRQHVGHFLHKPCNREFDIYWGNFKKFHNCPFCGYKPNNSKPREECDYIIFYNKAIDKIGLDTEFTSKEMIQMGYSDPVHRRNIIKSLKTNKLLTAIKKGKWKLNEKKI